LASIEKAYHARSIIDLDTSIAQGFDAVGVDYVGLGAIPPNGLPQLIERRRSDLRQARWLDVAGNVALDPEETDHFVNSHSFRVENAFLTRVAPLRASVCAFAETGEGGWRDSRQVAAIRLLSRYYVSFASILHDPLARPDIELTSRQRECLQWAAIGKTDRQISEILDLDFDVVGEQIRGARFHLGAETREQAVIEAIARGLIAPPFC
jgi:LuxR family quorum sensing-dependent transcriptional regulator